MNKITVSGYTDILPTYYVFSITSGQKHVNRLVKLRKVNILLKKLPPYRYAQKRGFVFGAIVFFLATCPAPGFKDAQKR